MHPELRMVESRPPYHEINGPTYKDLLRKRHTTVDPTLFGFILGENSTVNAYNLPSQS